MGRFAPSPTGPLHLGSLVAALGSFLDARAQGGRWRLRMEDLDPGRSRARMADHILHTLEAFGLHWDGPVLYQSRREEAYAEAVARLRELGRVYACACTRKQIRERGRPGLEGTVYPGTCRLRPPSPEAACSLRLDCRGVRISFHDLIRGRVHQHLEREIGDFVIRRADGPYAYQLAVVVDDAWQGVTRVVRGADLLASTPRQIYLQSLLGLPTPEYAHLPLVRDPQGHKLSKQQGARALDPDAPIPALLAALAFLGQPRPPAPPESVEALLEFAVAHWRLERVGSGSGLHDPRFQAPLQQHEAGA